MEKMSTLLRFGILGICMFLLSGNAYTQGWIQEYGGPASDNIFDFIEMADGGYLFVGGTQSTGPDDASLWVGRTNVHRQLVWDTIYPYYPGAVGSTRDMIQPLTNGNFRITAADYFDWDAVSIELTPDGAIDTIFTLENTGSGFSDVMGSISLPNDGTATLKRFAQRPVIVGSDQNGEELWWTQVGNTDGGTATVTAYDIVNSTNGTILVWIRDYLNDAYVNTIVELDQAGQVLGQTALPDSLNFNPRAMALTPDGGVVMTGYFGSINNSLVAVVKLDSNFEVEWTEFVLQGTSVFDVHIPYAIEVDTDGTIGVVGTVGPGSNTYDYFAISLAPDGTPNWERQYDINSLLDLATQIKFAPDGDMLVSGTVAVVGSASNGFLMALDGATGDYYTHVLRGHVAVDDNGNCTYEAGETPYLNLPVQAEGAFQTFYGSTDQDGYYEILVDTGNYVVSVNPPLAWAPCDNDQGVAITTFYDTTTVDFSMQAQFDCTELDVEVGVPFLRICDTTMYTFSYCNYGTLLAEDAFAEVFIDTNLVYLDASVPLVAQDSSRFEFDLGDIGVLECGSFTVTVSTPCDVDLLGDFYCVSVQMYPDEICGVDSYEGPILELTGECNTDSIQFLITNIGDDMTNPHEYIVIEDNIILMSAPIQLEENESRVIKVASMPGAIYHLITTQADGFPVGLGNIFVSETVAACEGDFAGANFNAFAWQNGPSTGDLECQPLVGAYDPNDKQATPTGWEDEHFIPRNVPLDYRIRFQNTGTDTAFNVVIVDTLTEFLDPSTIQFGASSHDYRPELLDGGILRFTFSNIMLPDSNINEPASHGFIDFKIQQQRDLPYETVIENFADIYFDFNPPIRTNTTFHTIQPPLVMVITSTVDPRVADITQIAAFPNPAQDQLTIELEGTTRQSGQYELYNLQGQRVSGDTFNSNRFTVSVAELPAGVYTVRLFGEDRALGTVRILVSK